jgi:hypothetical protein
MASRPTANSKRGLSGLAWPAALFLLALATPPELSVNAGSLRISAYRAVLLAFCIPCFVRLATKKAGPWHVCDGLIIFHSFWAALAMINYAGIGQGLESGGIYFIEATGAYLLGRCYVTNTADYAAMSRLMMRVVFCMCGIAMIESVTGQHFVREFSRAVLGGPSLPFIEPRMGLHRAYGSFDHPILFGIFCASTFSLAFYYSPPDRPGKPPWLRTGVTVLATFFSLSAGAFSALGVQIMLVAWDLMTRGIGRRWTILSSIFATIMLVISLSSNRSPLKVFLTYFTFSTGTGYNRLRIFDCGSAEVARHPILGIGLGDWERPSWMVSGSMDNFWLATAVRYGLPAFFAFAGAVIFLGIQIGVTQYPSKELRNCRSAWIIGMIGLSIAGSTVHYWNALFCLFCFLIGSGVWIGLPGARRIASAPRARVSQIEKGVSRRNTVPTVGLSH